MCFKGDVLQKGIPFRYASQFRPVVPASRPACVSTAQQCVVGIRPASSHLNMLLDLCRLQPQLRGPQVLPAQTGECHAYMHCARCDI